jgi:hypothetical protein
MLHSVVLVRTEVSAEHIASIIRLKRIRELGTTLAVTSSLRTPLRNTMYYAAPISPIIVTLIMEALRFSETSILTRATLRNISEDGILHSHRREDLKSHMLHTKRSEQLFMVRFEVFTAVTMKNCVFWVVTPYGSYKSHTA